MRRPWPALGRGATGIYIYIYIYIYTYSKAIPLEAWTGPEDTRRLRLPDFMTLAP